MSTSIQLFLSGGASNTNPANSIGGVMSSERVWSQTVSYTTTSMGGVTLIDGAGNDPGTNGQLRYTHSTTSLAWKPPGASTFGPDVDISGIVSATVLVVLQSETAAPGGSYLTVTITAASIPTVDTTRDVTVARIENELFPDVTAVEAESGIIRYRGIYVKRDDTVQADVSVTIPLNSNASDYFSVGWSAEDALITMETLANDSTAPTGVNFYHLADPENDQVVARLGSASTSWRGLWIRQTVPAYSAVGADPAIVNFRFRVSI